MLKTTRHLYVHAPLCSDFCTFCDFKRDLLSKHDSSRVVDVLLSGIEKFSAKQFDTIYIGGGTPNAFPDQDLMRLLSRLNVTLADGGEFTIECNPDAVTEKQAKLIAKCGVNRISIGVQSTNEKILKLLNRTHNLSDCKKAINFFRGAGIENISADFMYALPLMRVQDVLDATAFVKEQGLQHVSFYGLDLKPGSQLTKQKYKIDLDAEADQLEAAISAFAEIGYERYEVSNWALSSRFRSRHNLAYWLTKDWAAVGYGAHGLENRIAYRYEGTIEKPALIEQKLTDEEYFCQVLLMGLRLTYGIDISAEPYKSAYAMFGEKLKHVRITQNRLACVNVNLLNETLLEII